MENTVRIYENHDNTIPYLCERNIANLRATRHTIGDYVAGYTLVGLIKNTTYSEVWYCTDAVGGGCVIKLTDQAPDYDTIQRIREIDCANLVPILDCDYWEDEWYEIYPYYRNGHLQDVLEVEVLKQKVMPGIIKALDALHTEKIIHNDIKPDNLYWDDDMETVLLGDFGNCIPSLQKPKNLTISYAAPELILGDVCRRATDWSSVGLTLAYLLTGKKVIQGDSLQAAARIWEKGIVFSYSDFETQRLVNGMLNVERDKRLGPFAAQKWCEGGSFGGNAPTTSAPGDRTPAFVSISFENPAWVAADIEGLLQGIESHWEHSVFLFDQSKFDHFLGQFDKKWVAICRELRKMVKKEDALYRLTLLLSENESFIWRGKRYYSLIEMEDTWVNGDEGEKDVCTFLQRGHVNDEFEQEDVTASSMKYVNSLKEDSKLNPYESTAQLFQALRGNDGLEWYGSNLRDLPDIVSWLDSQKEHLDSAIDTFFENRKFEAWFSFKGMENVMRDIRRKSEI